jgi:hypothetical protein
VPIAGCDVDDDDEGRRRRRRRRRDQIDGTLRSKPARSSLTWSERSVGNEEAPRERRRALRRHRGETYGSEVE